MADNTIIIIKGDIYNKTSVIFGTYYKHCMFFSNVELFWDKCRICSCKNIAKKCFDKSSSEQQNGVSNERRNWQRDVIMNVEPGNVTS